MLKRIVMPFALALVLTIILQSFDLNQVVIYTIVFIVIFAILYAPVLYITFQSTNIDTVEKFLKGRIQHPQYKLQYALANNDRPAVEETIEILLKKHKRPSQQALYQLIFALYNDNILEAKRYIDKIQQKPYRLYYEGVVAAQEQNYSKATKIAEEIKSVWMKYAIYTEIHKNKGDSNKAVENAKKAIDSSRGLQRYMLFKTFKREFPNNDFIK